VNVGQGGVNEQKLHGASSQRGRLAPRPPRRPASLRVEYAERGKEYGILFIFSL